jgi:peptidyl-prolyl cis-trans isomerase B (cyclophilin B)
VLLIFAAPKLEIPTGSEIQLDGVVQPEEWADARELKSETHFVKLKRNGRWLALAFGGEGRYARELVRLQVTDEAGAWQNVLLTTGGQPTEPPGLWARDFPPGVRRALTDSRIPLQAPRGVRARMRIESKDSWSAEYMVRLGVLGIGRGDERAFRVRLVFAERGLRGKRHVVFPEGSQDEAPIAEHAALVSPDGWGAKEAWAPISTDASYEFNDHLLLWRMSMEHQQFNIRGDDGLLVIASAVRSRSLRKISALRRELEAGMKRNPTLPAWRYFLGRLLHEANLYEEARKLIEETPEAILALDAMANLAAEHYVDTEEWEKALAVCRAYPRGPAIREAYVAANTVRMMKNAEAELEKKRAAGSREDNPIIRFHTKRGVIEAELFEDDAPHTVLNFIDLALKQKYFDGQRFVPVIGGMIARLGNPRTRAGGEGGPDGPQWKLRPDTSPRQPLAGRLVTLPLDDGVNHGSQFGIVLAPMLRERERVTVFGRIVKGMDVVLRLEEDDLVEKVEVVRKRNHGYDALSSRVK